VDVGKKKPKRIRDWVLLPRQSLSKKRRVQNPIKTRLAEFVELVTWYRNRRKMRSFCYRTEICVGEGSRAGRASRDSGAETSSLSQIFLSEFLRSSGFAKNPKRARGLLSWVFRAIKKPACCCKWFVQETSRDFSSCLPKRACAGSSKGEFA